MSGADTLVAKGRVFQSMNMSLVGVGYKPKCHCQLQEQLDRLVSRVGERGILKESAREAKS